MKVFVLDISNADPYCGRWIIGVFSTREKAETHLRSKGEYYYSDPRVFETEIDQVIENPYAIHND